MAGPPSFWGPLPGFWASVASRSSRSRAILSRKFAKTLSALLPPTVSASDSRGIERTIGRAFGVPSLDYSIVGGQFGYGSGTDSALSIGGQTSYWGLGLTQGIPNTPVSFFVNFDHFENRVSGLGTVWNESMITGGIKIMFPSTDLVRGWIEPTEPLPIILRTVTNF